MCLVPCSDLGRYGRGPCIPCGSVGGGLRRAVCTFAKRLNCDQGATSRFVFRGSEGDTPLAASGEYL